MHGLGADPNLYAYVSGAVLKNVDPLGLCGDPSTGGSPGFCEESAASPETNTEGAPSAEEQYETDQGAALPSPVQLKTGAEQFREAEEKFEAEEESRTLDEINPCASSRASFRHTCSGNRYQTLEMKSALKVPR